MTINITHTADGDLGIYLHAPNGQYVSLSDQNGNLGDNYENTMFDDDATQAISSGTPPFPGSYRPTEALSKLNNLPVNGTWELAVFDRLQFDIGRINGWSLEITPRVPVCQVGHPPTVTTISPITGPTAGGATVTITGTHFVAPATVKFGTADATNVVVVNGTTITATTPAHAAGAANVVVTTGGTPLTLTQAYTYAVISPAPGGRGSPAPPNPAPNPAPGGRTGPGPASTDPTPASAPPPRP